MTLSGDAVAREQAGIPLPYGDGRFSVHGGALAPTISLEQLLKRLDLRIHLISRRNFNDPDFSGIVVPYRNLVLEQSVPPKKDRKTVCKVDFDLRSLS
jgi:hypothetical protein